MVEKAPTDDRRPEPSKIEMAKAAESVALAVGQITELMRKSPVHRHLFIADMEWLVIPPVIRRQCRIWRNNQTPVAYVSWARVSEEVEQRLKNGQARLKPNEWSSGDRNWVIDMIAPPGKAEELLQNLRETQFKGQELNTLRDHKKPAQKADKNT